jgi:hypothetical protein
MVAPSACSISGRIGHEHPAYFNTLAGAQARAAEPQADCILVAFLALGRVALGGMLLDEFDEHDDALGSKGVGKLGICSAGAAVANAIYNACSARVRDYPITLDKVLPALG